MCAGRTNSTYHESKRQLGRPGGAHTETAQIDYAAVKSTYDSSARSLPLASSCFVPHTTVSESS